MNFDFSDEQKQMRDEARKFLARKMSSEGSARRTRRQGCLRQGACGKASPRWAFSASRFPEEFGGTGAGHLELCVIAEEMGRALAPVPFSSTVYLAAEALMIAGSDAQKKKWLPKIASGEAIGTLALFEGIGQSVTIRPSRCIASERHTHRRQEAGARWRHRGLRHRRRAHGFIGTRDRYLACSSSI